MIARVRECVGAVEHWSSTLARNFAARDVGGAIADMNPFLS